MNAFQAGDLAAEGRQQGLPGFRGGTHSAQHSSAISVQ